MRHCVSLEAHAWRPDVRASVAWCGVRCCLALWVYGIESYGIQQHRVGADRTCAWKPAGGVWCDVRAVSCVLVWRGSREDLGLEAEVEHAVSLVDGQVRDPLQVCYAPAVAAQHVDHAPRSAHHQLPVRAASVTSGRERLRLHRARQEPAQGASARPRRALLVRAAVPSHAASLTRRSSITLTNSPRRYTRDCCAHVRPRLCLIL